MFRIKIDYLENIIEEASSKCVCCTCVCLFVCVCVGVPAWKRPQNNGFLVYMYIRLGRVCSILERNGWGEKQTRKICNKVHI